MEARSYHLSLDIDHAAMAFSGRVAIDLVGAGGELRLDALDLNIKSVACGGKALTFKLEPSKEALHVAGVPVGTVTLVVEFSGKVAERAFMGPYRSEYGASHIFTTQFEATGCRRFFPCLDHPAQKAVFHVEVTAKTGLKVIFNTPESRATVEGDQTRHTFAPTPKMSTYLLYFGVGPFEEASRPSTKGYEVIVATPPGRVSEGTFALDRAAKMVDQFATYFGNPYPLPKLHLIAVPNMGPGAMENWGAIAFRERVLLANDRTSVTVRKTISSVMAHEIAHQWFGNLVTMCWWNDIWLNESFATFAGTKVDAAIHPDWEVWDQFLYGRTGFAFLWDSVEHTHPIDAKVDNPDEIHQMFDEISYGKGASVLRMMEAYLGEEAFTAGVRRYLDAHRFGNATGQDLWSALGDVAHQPVGKIMDAWIKRPGYPAVTVRRAGTKLVLSQKRFTLEGEQAEEPWPIPLTLLADGKVHRHLMEDETLELPHGNAKDVVVNLERAGFYRVRYEGELGDDVRARFTKLSPIDRWGRLNDEFAFALAGDTPMSEYLDLVRSLERETSGLVIREAIAELMIVTPLLAELTTLTVPFRQALRAQLTRLGPKASPGESENTRSLRGQILGALIQIDPDTASQLASEIGDYETADPDRRAVILTAHAICGGAKVYPDLLARFRATKEDDEGARLARALASLRDPATFSKVLDLVLDPTVNPARGIDILASAVGANPYVRDPLWAWLKANIVTLASHSKGTGLISLILQWAIPTAALGRELEAERTLKALDIPESEVGMNKGFDLLAALARLRRELIRSLPKAT